MNMKNLKFYLITMFIGLIISCTSEQIEKQEFIPVFSEDYGQVIGMVNDFKESHDFSTSKRSSNDSKMNIRKIKTKTYAFDVNEKIAANPRFKRDSKNGKKLEVLVSTVEFEENGKEGFSIATDDERIKRVYAFTESGKLSDTTFNIGLKAALHDIELICEQDLMQYYAEEDTTVGTREAIISGNHLLVPPITGLQWGQDAPFNQLAMTCSSVNWIYAGHAPAGCVPVAIAQSVAYLCPPALSSYNISGLRNIIGYAHGTINAPWVSNMAVFLRYIGSCVNISYGCGSSGALTREIRNEFDSWGIGYVYRQNTNVDIQDLAYNLYLGYPHITAGFTKNPREGHAWIWEGIDCFFTSIQPTKVYIVPNSFVMVYCNWGWGLDTGNGWYAQSNMEQPSIMTKPFLDDNDQIYINNLQFTVPPRGPMYLY